MRNKLISTEIKKTEFYSGIQIKADLGVHEQAFDLFSKYVKANSPARNSLILEKNFLN